MKNYLFCLIIVLMAAPSFAWHTNTHAQTTRDAVALMPPDLQEVLKQHERFATQGVKDPDELIKDWQNHYYIPAIPEGGGLDRIDKLVKTVQMKIQGGNNTDASKQLCYLSHYIADLWSPENLIKASTAKNIRFIENNAIIVLFEGHRGPVDDIRKYLQARSEWRWKLENSNQMETLLYSEAVNDIARVWLTIWQQSGKTVEPVPPSVIEHNRGALNINFERLLKEEKVNWYAARGETNWMDAYDAHQKEVERLQEAVAPSEATLYARTELRNTEQMLSKLSPDAPFQMMETSLKQVGDNTFLVARIKNKSQVEIPSIAFMYPGVKGPVALLTGLKPAHITKIEALLPLGATKEQIQLIFSTPPEEE